MLNFLRLIFCGKADLLVYCDILHYHGPESDEARDYRHKYRHDLVFQRRADTLAKLWKICQKEKAARNEEKTNR